MSMRRKVNLLRLVCATTWFISLIPQLAKTEQTSGLNGYRKFDKGCGSRGTGQGTFFSDADL